MITASPQQLRQAADIQERIQTLQAELNQLLGGEIPIPSRGMSTGTRKMSAVGRAAISAAAKARWAKFRSNNEPKPAKKRKMSATAKAKMSSIAKARWAAAKKAGKSRL